MTPSRARRIGPVLHILQEALDAVAAPPTRDRILADALARARRLEVPESAHRLREFVHGAFHEAVVDALGAAIAEQVLGNLALILDVLELDDEISEVRASSALPGVPPMPSDEALTHKHAVPAPEEEITELRSGEIQVLGDGNEHPTDVPPDMRPVVLLASGDPETLERLREGLVDGVLVAVVDDPITMLDAIESTPALRVVVLDVRNPTVQPVTLAAMAPDLAAGVHVLMWGVTPALEAEINALGAGTGHWVGCGPDTSAEDVAFLCLTMLRDLG